MDRFFKDSRPIGPFLQMGSRDVSEFDKIEVNKTPTENTEYTVAGIFTDPAETVGVVVDTNALTISCENPTKSQHSFSLFEQSGECSAEFLSPEDGMVGIGTQTQDLVEIVIEP